MIPLNSSIVRSCVKPPLSSYGPLPYITTPPPPGGELYICIFFVYFVAQDNFSELRKSWKLESLGELKILRYVCGILKEI